MAPQIVWFVEEKCAIIVSNNTTKINPIDFKDLDIIETKGVGHIYHSLLKFSG